MADACRVAPEQETREAASGCHPKPRGAKAYFPTSLHPGPRRLVGGGRGHGGLRDGGLHLTGQLIDSGYKLDAIIGGTEERSVEQELFSTLGVVRGLDG